jgi:osmoprotectant transport system substrate-binding protein
MSNSTRQSAISLPALFAGGVGFLKRQERDWKVTVVRSSMDKLVYQMLFPYLSIYIVALATTAAYAHAHGLHDIGGLARVGPFALGAPPTFDTRATGLPALRRAYGISGARFVPLSLGAQYPALNRGRIQVAEVVTTDPALRTGSYVVLADPKRVFGVQNVVPVFSRAVIAAEGPTFTRTLEAVSAKLTTTAMRRMNAAVEVDKRSPADVARDFLRSAGLT